MIQPKIAIVLTLFLASLSVAVAQSTPTEWAMVLEVRYGKVDIQRQNTTAWLPVSVGSIMPFGAGDRVRTNDTGRVYLSFEQGELLVLPATTVQLVDYRPLEADRFELILAGEGVVVQHLDATQIDYQFRATDFVVTDPASLSTVWSLPEQYDTFAVAEGVGFAKISKTLYEIEAENLLWGDPANPQTIPLPRPLNAARLEATLLGCPAVVRTSGGVGVNVRRGIGQFNERLGLIPDGATVNAMAINEAGYWVRIQYLSGFSWIVEDAVEMDCPNLPRLNDNTLPERISSVINPLDSEVILLEPFFQTPAVDGFFYLYQTP